MSDESLLEKSERIFATHQPYEVRFTDDAEPEQFCAECTEPWPCDMHRLAAEALRWAARG